MFSARISTDNHVLKSQELSLSPLMVPLENSLKYVCQIKQKKEKNETAFTYLTRHKEALFECLLGEKVYLYDDTIQSMLLAQTTTHLKVLPARFTVEFKDEFANISLLLDDK